MFLLVLLAAREHDAALPAKNGFDVLFASRLDWCLMQRADVLVIMRDNRNRLLKWFLVKQRDHAVERRRGWWWAWRASA